MSTTVYGLELLSAHPNPAAREWVPVLRHKWARYLWPTEYEAEEAAATLRRPHVDIRVVPIVQE